MSVRRLAETQPEGFSPNRDTAAFADAAVKKYPEGKQASAVIPLLWRVQEQNGGWVSEPAIRWTADRLDMPYIRVYEVATFYTMFNLRPVGEFHVQLCGTTPCMLRGSEELKTVCRDVVGEQMDVTSDGKLSWVEVECLGACVNAPMVQIGKDYYEDLTPEDLERILADLRAGKEVKPGPQNGRHRSEPLGGALTLLDGAPTPAKSASGSGAKAAPSGGGGEGKPKGAEASEKVDDLKLISGLGPKLESALNELGVFRFSQIAEWTEAEIDGFADRPNFGHRIRREDWVGQAAALAAGGAERHARAFGGKSG